MKNSTKQCILCGEEKPKTEFQPYSRRCNTCIDFYRCSICGEIKERELFIKSRSRCKKCDNRRGYERKKNNPTPAYLAKIQRSREKVASKRTPRKFVSKEESEARLRLRRSVHRIFKKWRINKFKSSYEYLSFSKQDFFKVFPEIQPNEDIDHKIPLSWFKKETPINLLFDLENLQLMDRKENMRKNNFRCDPVAKEYRDKIMDYIKEEYKERILTN